MCFVTSVHTEPALEVRSAVKTVRSCQSFALSPETVHFVFVNDVVVGLPCRKDVVKVFFREVNTNKYD